MFLSGVIFPLFFTILVPLLRYLCIWRNSHLFQTGLTLVRNILTCRWGHNRSGCMEHRCGDMWQLYHGGVHDIDSCMVLGDESQGGSTLSVRLVGASAMPLGLVVRDWVRWPWPEPVVCTCLTVRVNCKCPCGGCSHVCSGESWTSSRGHSQLGTGHSQLCCGHSWRCALHMCLQAPELLGSTTQL